MADYYCSCGEVYHNRPEWAAHKRWNPDHTRVSPPREEPKPMGMGNRPVSTSPESVMTATAASIATDKASARTSSGATYLRETIYVPATLRVYYDVFRGHFDLNCTFSEWIVDCVLTLIEESTYELALIRKDGTEEYTVNEEEIPTDGNMSEVIMFEEMFKED